MRQIWWKILTIILLFYTFFMGLLGEVPARAMLNETIRNLYFHVPMWFGMIALFTIGVIQSVRFLNTTNAIYDLKAHSYMFVGLIMGILGLLTGMVWAKYTWGNWWAPDPKLYGSAITLLMYFSYFVLKSSTSDKRLGAKFAAVYSIIAYVMHLVLIMVIPRIVDSLHPGNGGNPAFSNYDLDSQMRMVFYPAVIGWILLGVWIAQIHLRIQKLDRI